MSTIVDGAICMMLLLALIFFYGAFSTGDKQRVTDACMVLAAAVLLAFLAWLSCCGPTPYKTN